MRSRFLRISVLALCFVMLFSVIGPVNAQAATYYIRDPQANEENDPNDPNAAQNISDTSLITAGTGFPSYKHLFNGNTFSGSKTSGNASLTLEYAEGIGWLYFIFGDVYGEYTVTNNDSGESVVCGTNLFLHETIDLVSLFGSSVKSVTVSFDQGEVNIYELYVYTEGYLPGYVQKWEAAPEGKVDLILYSTHGDDDQLFFAGILPYYCALDYEVLVVYLTDHTNNHTVRIHEMLNGLWAVGVTNYPVFGPFPDFYEKGLEITYRTFSFCGYSKDNIVSFVLEQLRRYKPQVVIGHDFDGEYGHGQHQVYADCLATAVEISSDAAQFPELAEAYGVWDVPKAYFHLYPENQITMDWDTPMEELDGMTPFQVTQILGYPNHISQQQSGVTNWINGNNFSITKASQITTYSPCIFGLYRSTVGSDVEKNNFFENVISYKDEADLELQRLAEEEAARKAAEEEAARKAAEEEAARKAAEEAARKAAEEAAQIAAKEETERFIAAAAAETRNAMIMLWLGVIALVIAAIPLSRKQSKK